LLHCNTRHRVVRDLAPFAHRPSRPSQRFSVELGQHPDANGTAIKSAMFNDVNACWRRGAVIRPLLPLRGLLAPLRRECVAPKSMACKKKCGA
jgi:hypothetical protein